MKLLKNHKTFAGHTQFWSHESTETKTEMKFAAFIPEGVVKGCIIWLSGLTCNEENFITKSGAQKFLANHQLMVVAPDTSPRGLNLPGEHDSYDFGSGAGFYVDSLVAPYDAHYRMYSYVAKELYDLVAQHFGIRSFSIMGHSMGGHGALVIGLREAEKFQSISAFAPISHPVAVPWGVRAFKGYLGENQEEWKKYDTCELLKSGHKHRQKILIHQGTDDEFLPTSLRPDLLETALQESKQESEVIYAKGYDHSYYFISTFIEEHIKFHAQFLK